LSNFDIDKICKQLKLSKWYVGCNSRDLFDNVKLNLKKPQFGIINLEPSTAGHGTHWTIFLVEPNQPLEYCDSYGGQAPSSIKSLMHHNHIEHSIWNDSMKQKFDTKYCGWYCIHYAYSRLIKHESPDAIVANMNDNTMSAFRNSVNDQSL